MKYTEDDNGQITLEMTEGDYSNLMLFLGYAAGAMSRNGDEELYQSCAEFTGQILASK